MLLQAFPTVQVFCPCPPGLFVKVGAVLGPHFPGTPHYHPQNYSSPSWRDLESRGKAATSAQKHRRSAMWTAELLLAQVPSPLLSTGPAGQQ